MTDSLRQSQDQRGALEAESARIAAAIARLKAMPVMAAIRTDAGKPAMAVSACLTRHCACLESPEAPADAPGGYAAASAFGSMNDLLEGEARRIAHALHDESGQLLTMVHLKLADAAEQIPAACRPCLEEVRELLYQIEMQLRQLSHELSPTILEDLGLVPAVDFLAKGVAVRTGLSINFTGAVSGRFAASIETTIYRTVQEALTNVGRHARATQVSIRVYCEDQVLGCVVRDNGAGFDTGSPRHGGLGLRSIRERVEALSGRVSVHSSPGNGTELMAIVPVYQPL